MTIRRRDDEIDSFNYPWTDCGLTVLFLYLLKPSLSFVGPFADTTARYCLWLESRG